MAITKSKDTDKSVVSGHITIKGEQSDDTRLFQTSPEVKTWLTKDEARSLGLYWKD